MLQVLKEHPGPISVKEISDVTKFTVDDITNTLKHLGMIQFHKGQHVICALPDVIDKCGVPFYVVPTMQLCYKSLQRARSWVVHPGKLTSKSLNPNISLIALMSARDTVSPRHYS